MKDTKPTTQVTQANRAQESGREKNSSPYPSSASSRPPFHRPFASSRSAAPTTPPPRPPRRSALAAAHPIRSTLSSTHWTWWWRQMWWSMQEEPGPRADLTTTDSRVARKAGVDGTTPTGGRWWERMARRCQAAAAAVAVADGFSTSTSTSISRVPCLATPPFSCRGSGGAVGGGEKLARRGGVGMPLGWLRRKWRAIWGFLQADSARGQGAAKQTVPTAQAQCSFGAARGLTKTRFCASLRKDESLWSDAPSTDMRASFPRWRSEGTRHIPAL